MIEKKKSEAADETLARVRRQVEAEMAAFRAEPKRSGPDTLLTGHRRFDADVH